MSLFTKRPPMESKREPMNPQDYLDMLLTEAETAIDLGRHSLANSLLAHALLIAVSRDGLDQVGTARRAKRISLAAGRGA